MIKPRLIIIAGPNGAGKTTLSKRLLVHPWATDATYVNSDELGKNYGE